MEAISALFTKYGDTVEYAPGKEVYDQGSSPEEVYFVDEGEVQLTRDGQFLATKPAGTLVGETAALTGAPRTVTAVAMRPTRLRWLSNKRFHELFGQDATACLELARSQALLLQSSR